MCNAPEAPQRHALVWLNQAGWEAALAQARHEHAAALSQWREQNWPLVARRVDVDAAADEVCLGLPLPPDAVSGAKVRIALRVAAAGVGKATRPLELQATAHTFGPWRERLTALCDAAGGLDMRVFGSLAMQTLTGLPYVSPASDIDVLLSPASRQQLEDGVALLTHHAQHLPLDGEIVFPGGAAVSWKEWQMAMRHPAKVLVKQSRSVHLADTASLLATLTTPTTREAP